MGDAPQGTHAHFVTIARMRMPFGKYRGWLLMDLPERYLIWMRQKGFPEGLLGRMMTEVLEIKTNGLEYLFDPFREGKPRIQE